MRETLMILPLATQCRTFPLPFLTQLLLYIFFVLLSDLVIAFPDVVIMTLLANLITYIVIKTSKCHYKIHHLSQQPFVTYNFSPRGTALWDFSLSISCPLSTSTGAVLFRPCFGSHFIGFLKNNLLQGYPTHRAVLKTYMGTALCPQQIVFINVYTLQ